MSNPGDACERIEYEWQSLERQWRETSDHWRDATRDEFDKRHWQTFEQTLPNYIQSLRTLADVVAQARRSVC